MQPLLTLTGFAMINLISSLFGAPGALIAAIVALLFVFDFLNRRLNIVSSIVNVFVGAGMFYMHSQLYERAISAWQNLINIF